MEQVERMERLITKLLDTSRLQQGRLELHPEPMDLGALAREVVERCAEDPPVLTIITWCWRSANPLWASGIAYGWIKS
jgi:signal transduction histidine kinase